MNDFLNKELYINVAVVLFLTLSAALSGFNFDLTVIMLVSWFFFIVIHTVKLFGALSNGSVNVENTNIAGK